MCYGLLGKKGGRHNTLIPFASQLGRKDDLNNLMPIDTKNINNRHVAVIWASHSQIKGRKYKGIFHASNLVAIDPNIFIDQGETVLYADVILTDLIQFIQQLV